MSVRDNLDYLLNEKKELEQQIAKIENEMPRVDYFEYRKYVEKDVLDLLHYIEKTTSDETYSCETKDRFFNDRTDCTIRLGWVKDDIAKLQRVDLNERTVDMLIVNYTLDDVEPYRFEWQNFGDLRLWEQMKESLYQSLVDKVAEINKNKKEILSRLEEYFEQEMLMKGILEKHQADNNNEIVKEDNLDEVDDYIVDLDER